MNNDSVSHSENFTAYFEKERYFLYSKIAEDGDLILMLSAPGKKIPNLVWHLVVSEDSTVKLRTYIARGVKNIRRVTEVLNEANRTFRFVKFSLDDDNDIMAEYDYLLRDSDTPENAEEYFLLANSIVNNAASSILQAVWGEDRKKTEDSPIIRCSFDKRLRRLLDGYNSEDCNDDDDDLLFDEDDIDIPLDDEDDEDLLFDEDDEDLLFDDEDDDDNDDDDDDDDDEDEDEDDDKDEDDDDEDDDDEDADSVTDEEDGK